jgi:hypothetical protein
VKLIVLLPLFIFANSASGQNSKDVIGNYSLSHFMHGYYLKLKDSGKFIVLEKSDVLVRTATGNWAIKNKCITLTPTNTGANDSTPPFKVTIIKVNRKNDLFLNEGLDRKTMKGLHKNQNNFKDYFRLKKELE